MAGTYYFFRGTTAVAYDYDDSENTVRNSSKDRDVSSIISGLGLIAGATATRNRIAILDRNNRKIFVLDHNWNRVQSEDVSLSAGDQLQCTRINKQ